MLNEHIKEHIAVFEKLTRIDQDIKEARQLISETCVAGRRVFACGNGGSATDAQHFVAELTGRYRGSRVAYGGIALCLDSAAITAIGNDFGFNRVFSRQLEGLGKTNDVLVAISTSGNSANVLEAVAVAHERGIKTIGLTGRDGGALKDLVDVAIVIPSHSTARIQEAHAFLLHYFCEALEENLDQV